MKKQKLAAFDLDGTILDTLDDLTGAVNRTMREKGYPARTREDVRRFLGNGYRTLMRCCLPEGSSDAAVDDALAFYSAYYRAHCTEQTRPYDGIPDLLKTLAGRGWKLAVVSNKGDAAVHALCGLYFHGLYDFCVGERPDVARKPSPDALFAALRACGADPCDAVMIGDSEVDIRTAQNAGISCISVDWGFRDREGLLASGAPFTVSDVPSLLERLTEFENI